MVAVVSIGRSTIDSVTSPPSHKLVSPVRLNPIGSSNVIITLSETEQIPSITVMAYMSVVSTVIVLLVLPVDQIKSPVKLVGTDSITSSSPHTT